MRLRRIARLAGAALLSFLACAPASGQERSDEAGQFDFYVLSLSWSPSYCEGAQSDGEQCGSGRPYAFIVHGLWPQHASGWPEFCANVEREIPREVVEDVLPLMPSRSLVRQQWRKHGTCTGLSPRDYFDLVARARSRIAVPGAYERLGRFLTTSPTTVEAAFIASNPGLSDEGIAAVCRGNRLSEVRICLGKDLSFRACPEVDRRACRRKEVVMPPLRRGG